MQRMKWMLTISLVFSLTFGGTGAASAEQDGAAEDAAGGAALPFSDIAEHWAKDAILQAYQAGFVEGFEDGTFRPNDIVKADQFIVMILRAHSVTKNGKTEFDPEWLAFLEKNNPLYSNHIRNAMNTTKFQFQNDSSGYWAAPYLNFLFNINVIPSELVFSKKFDMYQKQLKRDAASYLLGSWFDKLVDSYDHEYSQYVVQNSGLSDLENFTQHTGIHRGTVLISGLINGYPGGYFYPQRFVTRAEALTMVLRLRDETLRKPIQLNLSGKHYTTNDGKIYLYNDKQSLDTYNKMLELAQKHVIKGYVNRLGGSTIEVFSNKDDFDKYDYYSKTGQFDLRPKDELVAFVKRDGSREMGFNYPITSSFKTSNDYLNALYELLAGDGKGKELRKIVEAYIIDTAKKDFTFNGKIFSYREIGSRYELKLKY
ncbi:S-layer homology domain-containing protein [Paenibacillus sp. PAMC21692]|uniref:S-layer homology domain-containing protein n=1 Tax=Paenibacillus sp. PAMC21692 TaxID=2762320 RepID=UPI00164E5717|nr:S-layer homology domain-containing protein [Paenibacillus sp. PAMC21692]QNK56260.1 S-layer homology domain-containing protein [Paenibacillus sp. PAMC21692]